MSSTPYGLFSAVGIEIEYMIVDHSTLQVKPITDKVLYDYNGSITNEFIKDNVGISNELVKHVIEIKNITPLKDLDELIPHFNFFVNDLNERLNKYQAQLMPTGMHPFMDPEKDTHLWDHGYRQIYQTYNKLFECNNHGWSNLQSMHINLPFSTDQEFNQLHNAIRLVLPLIPALTASTPITMGKRTDYIDTRLSFYKSNQKKFPQITGLVIPEFISTQKMYQQLILNPMYQAIAPHDKKGVLQYEWLNSRGAIARFERKTIEIRIVDTQESVTSNLSCAALIIAIIYDIIINNDLYLYKPLKTETLKSIYDKAIIMGNQTVIDDQIYLKQIGISEAAPITIQEIWSCFFKKTCSKINPLFHDTIQFILQNDNLSARIIKRLDNDFSSSSIVQVYQQLCECLKRNELFYG